MCVCSYPNGTYGRTYYGRLKRIRVLCFIRVLRSNYVIFYVITLLFFDAAHLVVIYIIVRLTSRSLQSTLRVRRRDATFPLRVGPPARRRPLSPHPFDVFSSISSVFIVICARSISVVRSVYKRMYSCSSYICAVFIIVVVVVVVFPLFTPLSP